MKELQQKTRQTLKGETQVIYKTDFLIYHIIYRTWNLIKSGKLLEEEYGKLIQVKWFNDEVLQKSKHEEYVQQIADITDEEGLKLA